MASGKHNRYEPAEETEVYRRRKRPVRVRSWLFDWRGWPWRRIALSLAAIGLVSSGYRALHAYVAESPRFRFEASGLTVGGLDLAPAAAVRAVFASDAGVPLGAIPLEERREQLTGIEWVAGATVTRLWPNRLHVEVVERVPAAYSAEPSAGGGLAPRLIDRNGEYFDPPAGRVLELPLTTGISAHLAAEERRARVALVMAAVADLDSAIPHYSPQVERYDVADPKNLRLTVVRDGEAVVLDMGREHFRHRFEVFAANYPGWRREHGPVDSIDLRYSEQVALVPASAPKREPVYR